MLSDKADDLYDKIKTMFKSMLSVKKENEAVGEKRIFLFQFFGNKHCDQSKTLNKSFRFRSN